jgi:hypothetical protein
MADCNHSAKLLGDGDFSPQAPGGTLGITMSVAETYCLYGQIVPRRIKCSIDRRENRLIAVAPEALYPGNTR